jgi:gas vesicle protein
MGQDPDAIRQEIEQTRERMGDTVDALGYKADVPARAKESISDTVDTVKSRITGIGSGVSAATPQPQDVKQGAKQAVGIVQENPLGLAIGATAAGFLAGMLIPSSRIEDERIGRVTDEVKEQARQTGQEALEHGKQIAQQTATAATQTASESGQAHAQQMSDSVKQSAEQLQQTVNREG